MGIVTTVAVGWFVFKARAARCCPSDPPRSSRRRSWALCCRCPAAALVFVVLYVIGGRRPTSSSVSQVATMVGVHVLIGIGEAIITVADHRRGPRRPTRPRLRRAGLLPAQDARAQDRRRAMPSASDRDHEPPRRPGSATGSRGLHPGGLVVALVLAGVASYYAEQLPRRPGVRRRRAGLPRQRARTTPSAASPWPTTAHVGGSRWASPGLGRASPSSSESACCSSALAGGRKPVRAQARAATAGHLGLMAAAVASTATGSLVPARALPRAPPSGAREDRRAAGVRASRRADAARGVLGVRRLRRAARRRGRPSPGSRPTIGAPADGRRDPVRGLRPAAALRRRRGRRWRCSA